MINQRGSPGRDSRLIVVIAGAESVTGMNSGRALAGRGFRLVGIAASLESPASRAYFWDQIVFTPDSRRDWLETREDVGARLATCHSGKPPPLLLLSSDALVILVSEERERLSRFYTIVLPEPVALERLMDKTCFHNWAKENGYRVPSTRVVDSAGELDDALSTISYPLILKPLVRTAAWDVRFPKHKLFLLESPSAARPPIGELLALSPRLLVQQWIPGLDKDVLFCLAYASREDGKILASYCGQKWLQWPPSQGSTAICAGLCNPELEAVTIRLLQQAGLRGLGSVEVKRSTIDGRLYLTEPTVGRPDFQSYLAVTGGINLVLIAACDALGISLPSVRHTERAVWMDEYGLLRSVREQKAWRSLLIRLLRNRIGHISCALWSWRDPVPFIIGVRQIVRRRVRTRFR